MKKLGISIGMAAIMLLSLFAVGTAAAAPVVTVKYSPALVSTDGTNLYMFLTGSDGNVYMRTAPDGVTWSKAVSLGAPGGSATSSPAVVVNGDALTVFARGPTGSPYSTTSDNKKVWPGTWTMYGGKLLDGTGVSAVSSDHIFVTGTDSHLYEGNFNKATSDFDWTNHGGVLIAGPSAVITSTGTSVFVCGSDHAAWSIAKATDWGSWKPAGGQLQTGTGPAAYAWSSGRVGIVVVGTDGAMWSRFWEGGAASGWSSLGGILATSPGATSKAVGTVDVMVIGMPSPFTGNTPLYQKTYNAGWGTWKYVGGMVAT